MKYLCALASVCAILFSAACSQSPEKLLATANKYHQNKKFKEASILYQKVIAKDKTNAEAYYREGLNLLDDRQPAQAIGFLRRAVDLNPGNTDASTKLAEIYLTAYASDPKKYATLLPEARDLSAKVLKKEPDSFEALRLEGLVAIADKNPDRALEAFSKANQKKPYSRDLIWWYAQTLVAVQHSDQAVSLVEDMLAHDKTWGPGYDFLYLQYSRANDRAKAEQILRSRMQNDASSAAGYVNLANYLAVTNRYSEAEPIIRKVLDDRKTFPAGHQIVGDFYVRNKKYDQALEQYNAGKAENSKLAAVFQERIVAVYSLTNRKADALALAKETADKNPKDTTANEVYATLLLQSGANGDLQKSLADLKGLVQKSPTNPILHLDLARAYFGLNNPDQALSEALEAARLNPRLMGARMLAGRIYENKGQHGKALEQTELILAAEPQNPEATFIHAQAMIGTGRADRGQAELEQILTRFPQMNEARLQLASLYLQQKAFDKAKAEYDQVWKGNPPDERGFLGLQTVRFAQGQVDDAIRDTQQELDKNPKNGALRFQLANFQGTASVLTARSNADKAKQYSDASIGNFEELLKTSPKSDDLWLRLGMLQHQSGKDDAALVSFQKATEVNPQSSNAFLNRALLLESMGKRKEASDVYSRVLGLDPQNALALNNLAFLNAESGTNLDQAMTMATQAQKQQPNSPDVSDTLGYVYLQKNLNAEALQIFRKVVQDQPQNSTFRFHLAMALLKQGDKQGAKDEAERAMKTAPPQQQDKIRSFVGQIG